jgi:hypothetical protein
MDAEFLSMLLHLCLISVPLKEELRDLSTGGRTDCKFCKLFSPYCFLLLGSTGYSMAEVWGSHCCKVAHRAALFYLYYRHLYAV